MKLGVALLFVCFALVSMSSQTPDATPQGSTTSTEATKNISTSPKNSILPELDKLETAASQITLDIGRLRIEKWKTGSVAKSVAQANADSVQRNLASALPGLIAALRAAPEDLNAEFKLYRNVNALCDVVSSLADATRAFGPNSDYEALTQQLKAITSVRRTMGDSLEELTATKQQELNKARAQMKTQQEQLAAAQAAVTEARKELVLAQSEPPKKPATKKKPVAKKPATPGTVSNSNSSGQAATTATTPKS